MYQNAQIMLHRTGNPTDLNRETENALYDERSNCRRNVIIQYITIISNFVLF